MAESRKLCDRSISRCFRRSSASLRALAVATGEALGIVGESGCGKTTTARLLLRLEEPSSGTVWFLGENITARRGHALLPFRARSQLVFQNPFDALNPRFTIGQALAEPLLLHGKAERGNVDAKVCELLGQVGLDPELRARYPHEFSGGQRQRVSIARALAVEPSLLLCDEVTSALDVSIQAQILDLLRSIQQKLGLSYLFITHDLGVVRYIADRVAVMYVGQIVELRDTESLFESPAHPYTKTLLSASPGTGRERILLRGDPPNPANPPTGCTFHTRCASAFDRCSVEPPQLIAVGSQHYSACWLNDGASREGARLA